ncbi:insertion element protein [Neobacillus sp. GCM10023253]|uniref:insertion element protein n=1 Tax=Neobacillus sp. GCM10023253 TaxID=3252644 RepID=UPI003606BC9E
MTKIKRLSAKTDNIVNVLSPVSQEEILDRIKNYPLMEPKKFAKRYHHHVYLPTSFIWNGKQYDIEYNFCINPFCKWFGLPQKRFENVKNKPSRYKLGGAGDEKDLVCNPDPDKNGRGISLGCTCKTVSNWSVVEEIKRLITLETLQDVEPDYEFHKSGCIYINETPFTNTECFKKKGVNKAKAQRYQCKHCLKITSVMPKRKNSTTYHQKRNDILLDLAKAVVNKVAINRTIEVLDIGVKTYYEKLELVYKRCLEFLERHEQKPLGKLSIGECWLNTDKMTYHLSNVRKKGHGRKSPAERSEESKFPTHIVITSEMQSRYVFRADIAYDWNFSLDDLALDTILYKDDYLHELAKKNARFRRGFTSYPMPPTTNDIQSMAEYENDLARFEIRSKYVDGIHVNATYTTLAHYWLIKNALNVKEWRIVTDEDYSILAAAYRVFAEEIKRYDGHVFLSKVDKDKSLSQAMTEYHDAKEVLLEWADVNGMKTKNLRTIAVEYMSERLKYHKFHELLPDGKNYKRANNPLIHPLASNDSGYRTVECVTDVSTYETKELARMLLDVNHNATDAFIQLIRRRISPLERPLVTARGDGKSYIYANFNPEYAQYALTILRVYFNFCLPYKTKDGENLTTAQRLGITDRIFELKDIIYMQ